METVNLGRSGLRVSRLCLGTMLFGSQCDEAASVAVMDAALDLGIDFVDTADAYPVPPDPATRGHSEEIVGRWLRGKRERVVIATKRRGWTAGANPRAGASRARTRRSPRSPRSCPADQVTAGQFRTVRLTGAVPRDPAQGGGAVAGGPGCLNDQ